MNLREKRMNRGLTVEHVASVTGIKPASLYYYERTGGKPRDAAIAKAIADFYEVRVTDLWPVEPPVAA